MLNDNTQKEEWYGTEIEAKADPLFDPATGKKLVLRSFFFAVPPDVSKPSNEEFIEGHRQSINTFLWKDGLEMADEPRVIWKSEVTDKLRLAMEAHNQDVVIIVPAYARSGSSILESPLNLNDLYDNTGNSR